MELARLKQQIPICRGLAKGSSQPLGVGQQGEGVEEAEYSAC